MSATVPDARSEGRTPGPARSTASGARPALAVSALRCVVTYVVVPVLAPAAGTRDGLATPVVVALLALGTALSGRAFVRSLRAGAAGTTLLSSVLLSLNLLAVGAHVG